MVSARQFAYGSNSWFETNEVLKQHPAVCIAAVNGFALGGGLTVVNNCDLAIASERAEFGMPEMSFNTFPGLAGPATIRRVLTKHAAYMILTARRIDAVTAERWGIVNAVVPHDQLLEEAEKLARHVAQFDAMALDWGKKGYRDLDLMPWSEGLVYGGYIGTQIRRADGGGGFGGGNPAVQRFLEGQPNPGQGANVLQAPGVLSHGCRTRWPEFASSTLAPSPLAPMPARCWPTWAPTSSKSSPRAVRTRSGRGNPHSRPSPTPGDDPWNRANTFNMVNRNKRGICLDLKHPRGRDGAAGAGEGQ